MRVVMQVALLQWFVASSAALNTVVWDCIASHLA